MSAELSATTKKHVLTVALEDYFQVGSFNQLIQRGQWYRFEPRLEHTTRLTLDLLDRFGVKATFFVLGWVADEFPELVREVADRGHEIASKGYHHRSIRDMTPREFRADLARARESLERATGTRIMGYRVADRWFEPQDLWAIDVLADEGYVYDSSIALIARRFKQEPWRRFLHKHVVNDRELWELPISSMRILGRYLPMSGGNYFRQFPHRLARRFVDYWHRTYDAPFVMYFHVWELDQNQPRINSPSIFTRLRHYRNLGKLAWVLEYYLQRYQFVPIADYLGVSTSIERSSSHCDHTRNYTTPRIDSRRDRSTTDAETGLPLPQQESAGEKASVTVVVPCYNEELILPYLANTLKSVRAMLASDHDLSFVFVDDCSRDNTYEALNHVFGDWPKTNIVRHHKNLGVTGAILTGVREAETEVVCSIDCDCTYDPHELANMIPLLAEDVDLVTASPYHPQGRVRNVPRWRLFLSKSASFLYRRVLRHKLYTYTSCFRVYRKSAVEKLAIKESGFLGVAELLGKLDLQGSHIVEYPTTLEVRMLGRSKMKTLRTIVSHFRLLTRLLFRRILTKKKRRPSSDTEPQSLPASSTPAEARPTKERSTT